MDFFIKYYMSVWVFFALLLFNCSTYADVIDAIVSKDGQGDYRSIQKAIDDAPDNAVKPYIIFIKKGTYNEKLFIEKSFITLLGEDSDSTQIIYPELRANWRKFHPGNDWGSAVINIGNKVTDLTIANLTVYNNYGSLYGNTDHQFALRGGGSRLIIFNCKLKADGGDTVSLWNTFDGMYYMAYCYFEGWVDYVCPRGWCYITDCRFFGHNLTASIWHDGSTDPDQKIVIRNSSFDGVKGFSLGRNHRDAQFYLIDCAFSSNMANKPIYRTSNDSLYKWGKHYYYHNCHRSGGNYDWFMNNLDKAPNKNLQPEEITAAWTFGHRWDPDKTILSFYQNIIQSTSTRIGN
ncbi:MAG: pectinesterase family protein [Bacteroidota bacterium]|nr:pectinesterase family protein [Bacteroidota bacterium]MDP4193662.1 pectinesterase family protein [Bacteroidota bacterium]